MSLIVILILNLLFSPSSQDEHYCLSDLPSLINNQISQQKNWRVGIHALSKKNEEYIEIFSHDEERIFLPASNTKIMTTSSILAELGEKYVFKTPLFLNSNDSSCLKLIGDPSMSYEGIQQIANFILSSKKNNKTVFVDFDSFFGKSILECPGTWELDDLPFYYSALPTTSIININHDLAQISPGSSIGEHVSIKSTISPIPIEFDVSQTKTVSGSGSSVSLRMVFNEPNKIVAIGEMGIESKTLTQEISIPLPRNHFLNTLRYFLRNEIQVYESTTGCNEQQPQIYFHQSDVLLNLLNYTLQVSDNTFAELFLRQIGARHRSQSDIFSDAFSSGLEYIQNHYLKSVFGVEGGIYRMSDGSGMSRQTFLSPKSLTTVLGFMNKNYPIYKQILPISGGSGTLKHRFKSYQVGMIRAKTGTLTGVGALSGYIISPKYFEDDIIFSIIINNSLLRASDVRKYIDQIAVYFAFTDPNC